MPPASSRAAHLLERTKFGARRQQFIAREGFRSDEFTQGAQNGPSDTRKEHCVSQLGRENS